MFQKYYSNNSNTKFIKELLRTTYIPTIPIWKKGMKILAGLTYIADGYIVKCKISSDGNFIDNDEIVYVPSSIYDTDEDNNNYFEIVEPYIPGKFYRGITTNFVSNSSLYDPETHYYLGEYLRMVRDLYNIDLMPYYNCWNGKYSDKLRINKEETITRYESEIVIDKEEINIPEEDSQGLSFELDSNETYYILSGIGDCQDAFIKIPKTYEGLPVKDIKGNAFNGNSKITGVFIPNTIQYLNYSISHYSIFNQCSKLKNVIFEKNSQITYLSSFMFSNCPTLKNVIFEEGSQLTTIGNNAFHNCTKLENIVIPNTLGVIQDNVFLNCSSLKRILCYGDIEDWNWSNITIRSGNSSFLNAIKYYYSETEPDDLEDTTNYWGYDTRNNFIIWNKVEEIVADVINSNTIKDGYKMMIVPIKMNTSYTLYIDSSIPIEICASYYDGVNLLNENYNIGKTYILKTSCSFSEPFLYRVDESSIVERNGHQLNTNYQILQNQLVMLIQIPEINTSTVVILEGDYTKSKIDLSKYKLNTIKYFGKKFKDLESEIQDSYFEELSSLTSTIDGNNYAFNDRLVEYLLLNVIDSQDDISKNIEGIQSYITSLKFDKIFNKRYKQSSIKGVWDMTMRKFIYDTVTNYNKTDLIYDVNGFVDKDTESLLIKGKETDINNSLNVR